MATARAYWQDMQSRRDVTENLVKHKHRVVVDLIRNLTWLVLHGLGGCKGSGHADEYVEGHILICVVYKFAVGLQLRVDGPLGVFVMKW